VLLLWRRTVLAGRRDAVVLLERRAVWLLRCAIPLLSLIATLRRRAILALRHAVRLRRRAIALLRLLVVAVHVDRR
jgi:hypothetical protein